MNRAVGIYEEGTFVPLVHGAPAMAGYDPVADRFFFMAADEGGNLSVRNLIWNTDTLAWEAATGSLGSGGAVEVTNFPATQKVTLDGEQVGISNFPASFQCDNQVDIDVSLTWVGGKITQIVSSGLGKVKTQILSWSGDELNTITTTVS